MNVGNVNGKGGAADMVRRTPRVEPSVIEMVVHDSHTERYQKRSELPTYSAKHNYTDGIR